jgi:hypothetical protein
MFYVGPTFSTEPRNINGGEQGPIIAPGLGGDIIQGGGGGCRGKYCANRVAGLYGLLAANNTAF